MNKAIKYRIYPNKMQEELLNKTFGCCRKIWNLMLSDKIEYYKETKSSLKTTPGQYKKDYPYLKEVDSLALANVQLNLQVAYKNFFRNKKIGFPKYKSAKKSKKTYTTNNQNGTIKINDKSIKLPKLKEIKAKIHRKPKENWKLKSATISQEKDGTYYVSVLFEYKDEIKKLEINKEKITDKIIGLDYKSDGFYVDSTGRKFGSPKYYRKSQKKLSKLQRSLSKKEKGSKNREKARQKIAKLQRHISNQRRDFLHKESTRIVNLYDVICTETLNMKAISNKGFGNGKATMDNGYGLFLTMLEYKLEDRGKYLVKVDKWYPSSQLCSNCGYRDKTMKYRKKEKPKDKLICPVCGMKLDRDENAAINIKNEGIRILLSA